MRPVARNAWCRDLACPALASHGALPREEQNLPLPPKRELPQIVRLTKNHGNSWMKASVWSEGGALKLNDNLLTICQRRAGAANGEPHHQLREWRAAWGQAIRRFIRGRERQANSLRR